MTKLALQQFPDLLTEKRASIDTATAGNWLSRRSQTMRIWALTGYPIQPRRINGPLSWPVSEIKKLLGVPA